MEVEVINNFFNEEDLEIIKQYCEDVQYNTDLKSKGAWENKLSRGRGDVDIFVIDHILDAEIHSIIYDKMLDRFNLTPKGIMFHYWQPESFISWHNDAMYSGAATVYLNSSWRPDDGGLFLYDKGDGIRGEMPTYNKCVFQRGGVPHSTTSTHWKAPVRKSLQVFFK